MSFSLDRRSLIAGTAALGLAGLSAAPGRAARRRGRWAALVAEARGRAALPYVPGGPPPAPVRAGEAVFLRDEFRAPGDPRRLGAAAAVFAVAAPATASSYRRKSLEERREDGPLDDPSAAVVMPFGERPSFVVLRHEDEAMLGLLDCPSVCAAAKLRLDEGGRAMRVEARLFFREDVAALAMAPCAALVGDTVREADALTVSSPAGDRLRPLGQPRRPSLSRYPAARLDAFGLTVFAGTAPAGERPPSLLVTPADDWGAGEVVLGESPASDEFSDNVAAAFVPRRTFAAGDAFAYRYGLVWSVATPPPTA